MSSKCVRCGQENYRETMVSVEITFDVSARFDGTTVTTIVDYEPSGDSVYKECNVCGCTQFEDVIEPPDFP